MQTEVFIPAQSNLGTNYLGRHVLAEFFGCNSNILNNLELIEKLMVEAAQKCGATVVGKKFHVFNPYGVSGVVIISESHLAIHTWPEYGYAAIDLFTCGDSCDPLIAYEYLKQGFCSNHSSYSELKRGLINSQTHEMVAAPFEVKGQMQE